MRGKQIRLFLAEGLPGGLTTLEIMNWTGRLLSAPRSDLAQLLQRQEAAGAGVYLLLGEDQSAVSGVRCYIGETDEVRTRLKQHHDPLRGKAFWTRAVIVTSKDANITKGHTRYLEARLIELATQAQRCSLENGTAPGLPNLPEADSSDMEDFIDQVLIALPVLGVNVFRSTAKPPVSETPRHAASTSPDFFLTIPKRGIHAQARQVDGEFTMLEGSVIAGSIAMRDTYSPSTRAAYTGYQAIHQRLVADGSVRIDGDLGVLTRDVVFSSPSTAGAIASGRSCNGRQQWVTAENVTFGGWEDRDLSQ